MPSWRIHWRVAELLGYEPLEEVERLIDSRPLHDLGVAIVDEPLEPLETRGAFRRKRLYREASRVLGELSPVHYLFYLHHAVDNIFERVKSSLVVGEKLRRDLVLRGVELDLWDIYLRIRDAGIEFPSPPRDLIARLYQSFDDVVVALTGEARVKVGKRLRVEESACWLDVVRRCIFRYVRATRNYIASSSRYWHPEKLIDNAKSYLEGRARFCIAVEASRRSRFYDYISSHGASLRAFYRKTGLFWHEALSGLLLEVKVPLELGTVAEFRQKVEQSWRIMRRMLEESQPVLENTISRIIDKLEELIPRSQDKD